MYDQVRRVDKGVVMEWSCSNEVHQCNNPEPPELADQGFGRFRLLCCQHGLENVHEHYWALTAQLDGLLHGSTVIGCMNSQKNCVTKWVLIT
jgi:hypothetical protein